MQIRERTKLIEQRPTGTSYGPATIWRCILGLALVIVVTLHGTYEIPVRDGSLTAAETKQFTALDDARAAASRNELLDDARAAAHRKELFDARRVHFQRVGSPANTSA